ncbi:MAG: GNAT family N-acetyltransferase [Alphaproteobacteria bacterium]
METLPIIRPFVAADASAVRSLFIRVNQHLAPDHMAKAFDNYVEQSLAEEIDQIATYYRNKDGSFFVAELSAQIVGMFGLESIGSDAMELRRMYVDPSVRGRGIGRLLLAHAEEQTRRSGKTRLVLSTSELQTAALSLYRSSGYAQLREELVTTQSNKTLGAGLRRFYFEKHLGRRCSE